MCPNTYQNTNCLPRIILTFLTHYIGLELPLTSFPLEILVSVTLDPVSFVGILSLSSQGKLSRSMERPPSCRLGIKRKHLQALSGPDTLINYKLFFDTLAEVMPRLDPWEAGKTGFSSMKLYFPISWRSFLSRLTHEKVSSVTVSESRWSHMRLKTLPTKLGRLGKTKWLQTFDHTHSCPWDVVCI